MKTFNYTKAGRLYSILVAGTWILLTALWVFLIVEGVLGGSVPWHFFLGLIVWELLVTLFALSFLLHVKNACIVATSDALKEFNYTGRKAKELRYSDVEEIIVSKRTDPEISGLCDVSVRGLNRKLVIRFNSKISDYDELIGFLKERCAQVEIKFE